MSPAAKSPNIPVQPKLNSTRRRRKPTMRIPDVDLAGGFRLDLRTGLLLVALLGQWYDSRNQDRRQAEIAKVQSDQLTASLLEVKRVQTLQGYDLNDIKVALASRGIFLKPSSQTTEVLK